LSLSRSLPLFLVLYFFLTACAGLRSPAEINTPASTLPALPTAAAPQGESASLPSPKSSPNAMLTETPQPTRPIPTPTPMPSRTPLPAVSLFVPDLWREKARSVVDQWNASPALYTWELVDHAQADVRLVNNADGLIIHETILALAIPFTLEWEGISSERAQEILNNGHEIVTPLPWIDMTADQKALRIDGLGPADDGYALKEPWSLVAGPKFNEALKDLAPLLQEALKDNVVHLAAVGDIMLDRSLGDFIRQGDLNYPFSEVVGRLQAADITVGNLESALGDTGEPEQKSYPFRAPPEAADALQLAGFDVLSLANNHGMDYGEQALLQALDLLHEAGVLTVGAGANHTAAHEPRFVEANGLKTAFFGYVNVPVEARTGFDTASWTAGQDHPGISWADPQLIAADVKAVRDQVDLVIVLLHSGYEYVPAPSEPQQEAARAAIEAGADLVIGHHAHILQGIEYYKDGVIIYGTANFAFVIDGPPETAIFHIWLDRDGVREIAIEPAIVQPGGKPRLADNLEAPAIRNQVYRLTNVLNPQ
jgi:poly-gamma-glutamate capsule biosynthesis protein CapA/YwtB (metallophosphatase superfamily)